MKSFWCFYCKLWTYLALFSSVSIVDFKQVNVSWDKVYEIIKWKDQENRLSLKMSTYIVSLQVYFTLNNEVIFSQGYKNEKICVCLEISLLM